MKGGSPFYEKEENTMKKGIMTGLILMTILLAFTGMGLAAEPKRGGTLTFAVATTPPTLDWHISAARAVALYAGMYIWEGLAAVDEKLMPQPMLADSWKTSRDGLQWTFILRRGVRFHNGKEMTSEDVVASLKRWREVSPRAELFARVKEIVGPDRYTVIFRLSAPMATLPYILAQEGCQPVIHPKEIIQGAPPNKLSSYVGTGPYKFGEWIPDRHIILDRFGDYSARSDIKGGLAGKRVAYLDRIIFRNIPEAEVRLAGLKTGEFDAVHPLPQEYIKELERTPKVRPVIIKFDMKPCVYFSMQGIMKNVKLRKAIRAALNMDEIMFSATGNEKFYELNPDQLWFRSQALWSDTGKEVYNQKDVALAKKLAKEAGYKKEPIRFLASATQFHHRRPAIQITEQLTAAGFNIHLDLRDWPTVARSQLEPAKWDLLYTRTVTYFPSEASLVTYCGFHSPETDKLLDIVNRETDLQKLRSAFEEFKRDVMIEQVPRITMGDMFALRAERERVRGMQLTYAHPLWNVWLED
jgi:peptide/nickel transport system substrate-binding protein